MLCDCSTAAFDCTVKDCEQICSRNPSNEQETCSCFLGYRLDGNGVNCTGCHLYLNAVASRL